MKHALYLAHLALLNPDNPYLRYQALKALERERLSNQRECEICGEPLTVGELCAGCARDNDPFFTSKYSADAREGA